MNSLSCRVISIVLCATATVGAAAFQQQAIAQGTNSSTSGFGSEDTFREVFYTAGYSAAFGAALGAALLPFFPSPSLSSLRYVAGGASIGFILGSGFAFSQIAQRGQGVQQNDSSEEDYGYEADSYSNRDENTLPSGALFVGRRSKYGISIPIVQPIFSFSMTQGLKVSQGAVVPVAKFLF